MSTAAIALMLSLGIARTSCSSPDGRQCLEAMIENGYPQYSEPMPCATIACDAETAGCCDEDAQEDS